MWLLSFDSHPPLSTMPSIFILPPSLPSSLPLGQSEERSDGSSSGAGSGPGESCFATERQRCCVFFLWPRLFFFCQTNTPCKFGRCVKAFHKLWMQAVMLCQSRWFAGFLTGADEAGQTAACSHCWLKSVQLWNSWRYLCSDVLMSMMVQVESWEINEPKHYLFKCGWELLWISILWVLVKVFFVGFLFPTPVLHLVSLLLCSLLFMI